MFLCAGFVRAVSWLCVRWLLVHKLSGRVFCAFCCGPAGFEPFGCTRVCSRLLLVCVLGSVARASISWASVARTFVV